MIDRDVLDAARSRFVAAGFDGTTMEAIAAQAGVTKATLYLRYPDKGALPRAVIGGTVEQRLRYFAHVLPRLAEYTEIRWFIKLVNDLFRLATTINREYQEILTRPMIDIISKEIASACNGSGQHVRDADKSAATLSVILSGIDFLRCGDDGTKGGSNEAFADYATDIFLSGRNEWSDRRSTCWLLRPRLSSSINHHRRPEGLLPNPHGK